MMQLFYTLTPLEIGEALRPVRQPAKSKLAAMGVLLGVWLVIMIAVFWNIFRRAAATGDAPDVEPGVQNLWATLLPSAIPVLYLITAFAIAQVRKRRLVRDPDATIYMTAFETVLMFWPLMLVFALLVPQLAIDWRPSPTLQMWTGLSPWFVLFFVFNLNQKRRKRIGNRAVEVNAGLLRPQAVVLENDGFRCADGVTDRLSNWAYFIRCRETPNLLLLITEDARTVIIPKRAVPDPSALMAVKSLLQNQIRRCDFFHHPTGFPVGPAPVPVQPIPGDGHT